MIFCWFVLFLFIFRNLKNLERLEIDSCLSLDDSSTINTPDDSSFTSRKSPLPLLKALKINQASPAVTLTIIARLVDPDKLNELIFNLEVKSTIANEAREPLKMLFKYLKCFKNLTIVHTNLFYCINLRQLRQFRRHWDLLTGRCYIVIIYINFQSCFFN